MERYKDELLRKLAKETILYAAHKVAMEYQLAGKPIPSADELVRLAVQRIKASSVDGEVMC